jgi:4-hydroxybenzoate polyprenyltransferase
MVWKKLIIYLRLGRVHSSVLTALAPVVAAVATNVSLSIYHYFELYLIGFLSHLIFFIYNEICDIKIDKTSETLKGKPLVDGSINIRSAKSIVTLCIILIFLLTIVFFKEKSIILMPIVFLAFIFGVLYDHFGKRIFHADYFVASGYFFLTLYGGFSVTQNPTLLVYIIGSIAFMQMLFQNIVAGLKDVDHDYLAGGISTPIRLGVKIKKETLLLTKKFLIYIIILKIIYLFLLISPFVYNMVPYESWQLLVSIILIVLTIFFMIRFLSNKKFDRVKIMRAIGFHEMFTFMVIPFILFGYIGIIGLLILVFLPVVWLGIFLVLLYGRLMPVI